MRVAEKHSHLNGEEYLLVHNEEEYNQIMEVISEVEPRELDPKISEEKGMMGEELWNPVAMNERFKELFNARGWSEERYTYYVTTDYDLVQETQDEALEEQRRILDEKGGGADIRSYKQTDFVNHGIAVEVQFGKYAFVAYDLFVKHLLFYSGGVIDVGVEVLPTKKMQENMSSGIAYFEGEVYNIMRHGRTSPPVPLLILGVEPE